MASLWTLKTQSGRNNCGKDSCVLNVQYCCENVGLYIFYLLIRFWCVLITTGIVYTHRINVTFLVICVCTLGIKYCHHNILFLSLCRHVFDAFSCNIHHEERYLKFADISFENIDTAKKYRDNIDTFLRRYPSPTYKHSFKGVRHGPCMLVRRGSRLNSFHMRYLRTIFKIKWQDKIQIQKC